MPAGNGASAVSPRERVPDVGGRDPAAPPTLAVPATANRNLVLRIASAAVLAPLALAAAYFGGWFFTIFWTAAAIAIWWEWVQLVDPGGSKGTIATGSCALLLEALLAGTGHVVIALMIGALGALAVAITAAREARWVAGGLIYASAPLLAPVGIRADLEYGFLAVLFLFAVVWSTDIVGYFAGRAFGGPKLAPSISPKKTWSGALAGTLAAVACGLAVVHYGRNLSLAPVALVAIALSFFSQLGDLFESKFKRVFDAKDASSLIPGHGGVMDRLDGFIFASAVAVLIGVVRAGIDSPAEGLLRW